MCHGAQYTHHTCIPVINQHRSLSQENTTPLPWLDGTECKCELTMGVMFLFHQSIFYYTVKFVTGYVLDKFVMLLPEYETRMTALS